MKFKTQCIYDCSTGWHFRSLFLMIWAKPAHATNIVNLIIDITWIKVFLPSIFTLRYFTRKWRLNVRKIKIEIWWSRNSLIIRMQNSTLCILNINCQSSTWPSFKPSLATHKRICLITWYRSHHLISLIFPHNFHACSIFLISHVMLLCLTLTIHHFHRNHSLLLMDNHYYYFVSIQSKIKI